MQYCFNQGDLRTAWVSAMSDMDTKWASLTPNGTNLYFGDQIWAQYGSDWLQIEQKSGSSQNVQTSDLKKVLDLSHLEQI